MASVSTNADWEAICRTSQLMTMASFGVQRRNVQNNSNSNHLFSIYHVYEPKAGKFLHFKVKYTIQVNFNSKILLLQMKCVVVGVRLATVNYTPFNQ